MCIKIYLENILFLGRGILYKVEKSLFYFFSQRDLLNVNFSFTMTAFLSSNFVFLSYNDLIIWDKDGKNKNIRSELWLSWALPIQFINFIVTDTRHGFQHMFLHISSTQVRISLVWNRDTSSKQVNILIIQFIWFCCIPEITLFVRCYLDFRKYIEVEM